MRGSWYKAIREGFSEWSIWAADICKADGESMIHFYKLLNKNQLPVSRSKYHIGNCCTMHHTYAYILKSYVPISKSNIYLWQRGNKDKCTPIQTYKVFISSLLPTRKNMLVCHLLVAYSTRIMWTFHTKTDTKSQNFSTCSEHSGSVHAGCVAKSKLLAPVHIAFLFILDHRFKDYDKEVFHPSIKGSTHLSNSFIIGFKGSSGVTDRLQSRT